MSRRSDIDPVLMQIIGGELDSIAKEMAHQLIRSARSALIRESEDMGAALLNTRCEEIAESDNTPLHVGSLVAYTQGHARDRRQARTSSCAPATSCCTTTRTWARATRWTSP